MDDGWCMADGATAAEKELVKAAHMQHETVLARQQS
jgi:hypothetical protein